MLALQVFSFRALWSPYFLGALIILTVVFFLVTIKFRSLFADSEPLTFKQGFYFTLSMVVLYAIKGSPIDLLAHLMFYVHMIQMAFLVFVVPPLVIWGIPTWIWRRALAVKAVSSVFKLFTNPIVALFMFNGLFSFYHIPIIFDHVMENRWLHGGYSILLFVVALFMWWPLINQLPEQQTLNGIKKVGYIFADGMLLTPACALIMFANTPLFSTYSDPHAWGQAMKLCVGAANFANLKLSGPEVFSSMSLIHDQQLGGVLMKIIQETIYGIMLGQVFFEWYRKDQAESEQEINQQKLNPSVIK